MGEHAVVHQPDIPHLQAYMKALLADLQALEYMLEQGMFESGVHRVGAEQELFLVTHSMRPAAVAMQVLESAADPRLTTEIAKFNLEANLTPKMFSGRCLRDTERELLEILEIVGRAAAIHGASVLLTGILPTLRLSDLGLNNLTPTPRYAELNQALVRQKGGAFQVHVKGLDELQISHPNVLLEGCNTSFQIHLQVGPEEFARAYNIAQVITAPVLAAAVNSPVLFGYRLWQETRIALFQHSVDARSGALQMRAQPTRVSLGERWVKDSVLEIFHDDLTRFRIILDSDLDEDPMEVLSRGQIPKLGALRLHNGSVWRWNRPCVGITDGRPHLRIENRVLPSGPTIVDEMANAALFLGLMSALPEDYGDVSQKMPFEDAKNNFYAAARYGLQAQFSWMNGARYTAAELLLDHLIPLAHEGLRIAGIDPSDSAHYLGVIEERVRCGQTGSQWALGSVASMGNGATESIRMATLTRAMLNGLRDGAPVHTWPKAQLTESLDWRESCRTVGQVMSTDLFTLRPSDIVDLAARIMAWRHVRHIPVEDDEGGLIGLVTYRDLIGLIARGGLDQGKGPVSIQDVMKTDIFSVAPDTLTLDAIGMMRRHQIGCLPVVEGRRLVGIVTAADFVGPAVKLFEEHLRSG